MDKHKLAYTYTIADWSAQSTTEHSMNKKWELSSCIDTIQWYTNYLLYLHRSYYNAIDVLYVNISYDHSLAQLLTDMFGGWVEMSTTPSQQCHHVIPVVFDGVDQWRPVKSKTQVKLKILVNQ